MTIHSKKKPDIGKSCFIVNNATIVGDVVLGRNCSVWHNAVIRGDENSIRIGKNVNIQDNCTLHVSLEDPLVLGDNITVGHNAVLHGCTIEGDCMIAMGAIVMNKAHIGRNCIIGAGSVVTEGTVIPPGSIVMGIPAKVRREATEEDVRRIEGNWKEYIKLVSEYNEEH